MKHLKFTTLILSLFLFGFNISVNKKISLSEEKASNTADDKEQIQNLIRQVYNWEESRTLSNNEMITDTKDSIYIGFNPDQLKKDIEELKATQFFAKEFIDNYTKIYTTLDKKLRNKEIEWLVGYVPPFGNDANPWCNCQDVPYDNPNPWNLIEIKILNLDNKKGDLIWKWGKVELNSGKDWGEFAYKFGVVKENEKWKISYLEGFNFEKYTRENE